MSIEEYKKLHYTADKARSCSIATSYYNLPFDFKKELKRRICSSLSRFFFEEFEEAQAKITQTNIARSIRNVGCFDPKAPTIKKKLIIVATKNFPNPVITHYFK